MMDTFNIYKIKLLIICIMILLSMKKYKFSHLLKFSNTLDEPFITEQSSVEEKWKSKKDKWYYKKNIRKKINY
jgi:hypothetical protein